MRAVLFTQAFPGAEPHVEEFTGHDPIAQAYAMQHRAQKYMHGALFAVSGDEEAMAEHSAQAVSSIFNITLDQARAAAIGTPAQEVAR